MNTVEFSRLISTSDPADQQVFHSQLTDAEKLGGGSRVLAHHLSVIRRRKWIIIACVFGALLVGLLVTLLMTPKFTASSTLEIERETRNFTQVQGVENAEGSAIDLEFYETQYGLLKAESLADRVATKLHLYENQQFFSTYGASEADGWFADGKLTKAALPREQRIRLAGDILLDNFELLPVRQSRLIDIEFTSLDPRFSQQVLMSWNENFIEETLERRSKATSYARDFLENRLGQLRTRIEQSERALVDYATRNGIVNLPATTDANGGQTGERSLTADYLSAINRELAQATAARIQAQSRAGAGGDAVTEGLENDAIGRLRERRGELSAEYARLMEEMTDVHPTAQALQAQITKLDSVIKREEQRVSQTLRENFTSSRERERELESRVDQLKSGLLDLRRRTVQYNILEREVDTNRELYDALLQRFKEIGVAGGVGVNNISVVVPPALPQEPSSPRPLLNLFLAALAGIALGLGTAFALEQLDETLSDPDDVERELQVPLLGTVPRVGAKQTPLKAAEDLHSPLMEAYFSLQTRLSFSTDHGVPRTLAVTSARSAEGKSTTSYALARSIARTGKKTVLVDTDLRSPSVHDIVKVPNTRGVSNYLAGDDAIDALVRPTDFNGLSAITAGPIPPSAPDLLASDRFVQLIEDLVGRFDHLVFDAPPVMGLADAPIICSRMEGTIFILESHSTFKGSARVALARLKSANARVIGALLTKFDVKSTGYGYGYGYGYGEKATGETE